VGASPVGTTLRSTDGLSVTIEYNAPDCTEYLAEFWGYHVAGSPWYTFWCVTDHLDCGATLPSLLYTGSRYGGGLPLSASSGRLTMSAAPGTVPPQYFGAPPSLEGFHVCRVSISLFDVRGQMFGIRGSGDSTNGGVGLHLESPAGPLPCPPP
jgi:hypothetical protein